MGKQRAANDGLWFKFCEALNRWDLADRPHFPTNALCLENRDELTPMPDDFFHFALILFSKISNIEALLDKTY
jgi:hypothetical protein